MERAAKCTSTHFSLHLYVNIIPQFTVGQIAKGNSLCNNLPTGQFSAVLIILSSYFYSCDHFFVKIIVILVLLDWLSLF